MKTHARSQTSLATQDPARTITLTPGYQVHLRWNRILLAMRPIDLLVLDSALRRWAADAQSRRTTAVQITFATSRFVLAHHEIGPFATMVSQATERLGRRRVYWVDVDVQILSLDESRHDAPWSYN